MPDFKLTGYLVLKGIQNVDAVINTLRRQLASVPALDLGTTSVVPAVKESTKQVRNLNKEVQLSLTSLQDFSDKSALALRRFTAFTIAASTVYGGGRLVLGGLKQAALFERELVKVQQVTGASTESISSLRKEIARLGIDLAAPANELVSVVRLLSQAGLSINQVKTILEGVALTRLASTFGSVEETTEGIIAIMGQFKLNAEDIRESLALTNIVAAKYAVESDQLIGAVKRAGGAFSTASKGIVEGNKALAQFYALFTSVEQTTRQAPETIATGLRTVIARLQRENTVNFLKQFNINLRDQQGRFVGVYEAIQRIGQALENIDPLSQSYADITEKIGGTRQFSVVIPLIREWRLQNEILNRSLQEQEDLLRVAQLPLNSLVEKFNILANTWNNFTRNVLNNPVFQFMAEQALDFANALVRVLDRLGPILPILTALGAVKLGSHIVQTEAYRFFFHRAVTGHSRHNVAKKRQGGVVPGIGHGDKIPLLAEPGEFVIRKNAVNTLGIGFLHHLNRFPQSIYKKNRYAQGGFIKPNVLLRGYDEYYPEYFKEIFEFQMYSNEDFQKLKNPYRRVLLSTTAGNILRVRQFEYRRDQVIDDKVYQRFIKFFTNEVFSPYVNTPIYIDDVFSYRQLHPQHWDINRNIVPSIMKGGISIDEIMPIFIRDLKKFRYTGIRYPLHFEEKLLGSRLATGGRSLDLLEIEDLYKDRKVARLIRRLKNKYRFAQGGRIVLRPISEYKDKFKKGLNFEIHTESGVSRYLEGQALFHLNEQMPIISSILTPKQFNLLQGTNVGGSLYLRQGSEFNKTIFGEALDKPSLGVYYRHAKDNMMENIIELATQLSYKDDVSNPRFQHSLPAVFRHEFGHFIFERLLSLKEFQVFNKISKPFTRFLGLPPIIPSALGDYATTDSNEFFAAAFSALTSKDYYNKIPKTIQKFFYAVFNKDYIRKNKPGFDIGKFAKGGRLPRPNIPTDPLDIRAFIDEYRERIKDTFNISTLLTIDHPTFLKDKKAALMPHAENIVNVFLELKKLDKFLTAVQKRLISKAELSVALRAGKIIEKDIFGRELPEPALGIYYPRPDTDIGSIIEVASGLQTTDKNRKYRRSLNTGEIYLDVGYGFPGVFRHEFGHFVLSQLVSNLEYKMFARDTMDYLSGAFLHPKEGYPLGINASLDPEELFADAFSHITSSRYNRFVPPKIKTAMQKLFKRRLRFGGMVSLKHIDGSYREIGKFARGGKLPNIPMDPDHMQQFIKGHQQDIKNKFGIDTLMSEQGLDLYYLTENTLNLSLELKRLSKLFSASQRKLISQAGLTIAMRPGRSFNKDIYNREIQEAMGIYYDRPDGVRGSIIEIASELDVIDRNRKFIRSGMMGLPDIDLGYGFPGVLRHEFGHFVFDKLLNLLQQEIFFDAAHKFLDTGTTTEYPFGIEPSLDIDEFFADAFAHVTSGKYRKHVPLKIRMAMQKIFDRRMQEGGRILQDKKLALQKISKIEQKLFSKYNMVLTPLNIGDKPYNDVLKSYLLADIILEQLDYISSNFVPQIPNFFKTPLNIDIVDFPLEGGYGYGRYLPKKQSPDNIANILLTTYRPAHRNLIGTSMLDFSGGHVFAHEFGHHIHLGIMSDTLRDFSTFLGEKYIESYSGKSGYLRSLFKSPISQRSLKSPREAIAEAYSVYVNEFYHKRLIPGHLHKLFHSILPRKKFMRGGILSDYSSKRMASGGKLSIDQRIMQLKDMIQDTHLVFPYLIRSKTDKYGKYLDTSLQEKRAFYYTLQVINDELSILKKYIPTLDKEVFPLGLMIRQGYNIYRDTRGRNLMAGGIYQIGHNIAEIPMGSMLDTIFKFRRPTTDQLNHLMESLKIFWHEYGHHLFFNFIKGNTRKDFYKLLTNQYPAGIGKVRRYESFADIFEEYILSIGQGNKISNIPDPLWNFFKERYAISGNVPSVYVRSAEYLNPNYIRRAKKFGLFAAGGQLSNEYINGIGSGDKIPILAEPGEFIIRKDAAKVIGYHNLRKLNHADKLIRKPQKFQHGGFVNKGTNLGFMIDPDITSLKQVIQGYKKKLNNFDILQQDVDDLVENIKKTAYNIRTEYALSGLKPSPSKQKLLFDIEEPQKKITVQLDEDFSQRKAPIFGETTYGKVRDESLRRARVSFEERQFFEKQGWLEKPPKEIQRTFPFEELETGPSFKDRLGSTLNKANRKFSNIRQFGAQVLSRAGARLASDPSILGIASIAAETWLPESPTSSGISGALAGASLGSFAGSMFGPIGSAIGTVAGGVLGGITGVYNKTKEIEEQKYQQELIRNTRELSRAFQDLSNYGVKKLQETLIERQKLFETKRQELSKSTLSNIRDTAFKSGSSVLSSIKNYLTSPAFVATNTGILGSKALTSSINPVRRELLKTLSVKSHSSNLRNFGKALFDIATKRTSIQAGLEAARTSGSKFMTGFFYRPGITPIKANIAAFAAQYGITEAYRAISNTDYSGKRSSFFDRIIGTGVKYTPESSGLGAMVFRKLYDFEEGTRKFQLEKYRPLAEQNVESATAARDTIVKFLKEGRYKDITEELKLEAVSDRADLIMAERSGRLSNFETEILPGLREAAQAERQKVQSIYKFINTLDLFKNRITQTADKMQVFFKSLEVSDIGVQNLLQEAQGNFAANIAFVNPFEVIKGLSQNQINQSIQNFETFLEKNVQGGGAKIPEFLKEQLLAVPTLGNLSNIITSEYRTRYTSNKLGESPVELLEDIISNVDLPGVSTSIRKQLISVFETLDPEDALEILRGDLGVVGDKISSLTDHAVEIVKQFEEARNVLKGQLVVGANQVAQQFVQITRLQQERIEIINNALSTIDELRGKRFDAANIIQREQSRLGVLTGGITDPNAIAKRIAELTVQRRQIVGNIQSGKDTSLLENIEKLKANTIQLQNFTAALEQAKNSTNAIAAIQKELADVERRRLGTIEQNLEDFLGDPRQKLKEDLAFRAFQQGDIATIARLGVNPQNIVAGLKREERRIELEGEPKDVRKFQIDTQRQLIATLVALGRISPAEGQKRLDRIDNPQFVGLIKQAETALDQSRQAIEAQQKLLLVSTKELEQVLNNNFITGIKNFNEIVKNLNIPEKIDMNVKHEINITAPNYENLAPYIRQVAESIVEQGLAKLTQQLTEGRERAPRNRPLGR